MGVYMNSEILNFKYFGENSIIEKPTWTNNPEHIHIDKNVRIGAYSWIQTVTEHNGKRYNPLLEIKENTQIGRFAVISANNYIQIGKNVLISERVFISDHIHEYENINIPIIEQPASMDGSVMIGDDCWLGIGCCILPNVEIGRHSIIGSNAVVTKNIPPYSVAAGIPAKVIRKFDFRKNEWKKIKWYNRLFIKD
jgi:acetyltransferase-like isoleucine patch superfamily enzyme